MIPRFRGEKRFPGENANLRAAAVRAKPALSLPFRRVEAIAISQRPRRRIYSRANSKSGMRCQWNLRCRDVTLPTSL